jgi:hypothetical protein
MTALRYIEIDGKRYLRHEIVQLRRGQRATMQPVSIGGGGAPALNPAGPSSETDLAAKPTSPVGSPIV